MPIKNKNITILGSTGSIGVQTLEVIDTLQSGYKVNFLTANSNIELLSKQIEKFKPAGVVVRDKQACDDLRRKINYKGILLCGKNGIIEAASAPDNDIVVSALVGFSGVLPTLAAIEAGTDVALANKETLVSAGSIITAAAIKNKVKLIAVDSEHSAVMQCLAGENSKDIEKIILTASGGPFLNTPMEEFGNLTVSQALSHPNWSMGNKITIDSATMMNKGFEVIEAHWLFGTEKEKIDVLIHPQSIVHSLVQFIDGSVKAQLGLPDMRVPIAYALGLPERQKVNFGRLDLAELNCLTFFKPDFDRFPCLRMAYNALEAGGTVPAVLNASNEIAVKAFLDKKIYFTDIPRCIEMALMHISNISEPSLNVLIEKDTEAREFTERMTESL